MPSPETTGLPSEARGPALPGWFCETDRQIIALAGPAALGFLGMILFDVANIFWIGRLGSKAVAGLASSGFVIWTLYAVMQITVSGAASLISQFKGAGKQESAREVVTQATWLSLAMSALIMVPAIPCQEYPFTLMGLDAESMAHAVAYFRVLIWGMPLTYLYFLAGHVFNAQGDTPTGTKTMGIALVINMILDPILIFGLLGLPALGVGGAALATLISQFFGLAIRIILMLRKGFIGEAGSFIRWETSHVRAIFRIGVPNALTNMVWSLVYPLLTRLITPFGMAPVSGVGICHRLESFPYFSAMGMGIAMTTLVGGAIGRNRPEEAALIVRRGLTMVSVLMIPFVALYILVPSGLVGLLTGDSETIRHGGEYLFAIGVFEMFLGWELLLGGVFTGLGRTLPTLLITLPFTLARIPLGYALSSIPWLGVKGIWWAISLSTLGKGLGLAILFRRTDLSKLAPAFRNPDKTP